MSARPQKFARNLPDLDGLRLTSKNVSCPHCRRVGMLIGHGLLFGYDEHSSNRVVRGRRFLCSRRFRRAGCGRTFSVLLASVIATFTVRTSTLSRLFVGVVSGGLCVKAAWEQRAQSGLTLRSGYRLWRRLLAAQSHLRTALCELGPPPTTDHQQPLAQLLHPLRDVLGDADCLFSELPLGFQQHLLA